jgi:hypothetical protein
LAGVATGADEGVALVVGVATGAGNGRGNGSGDRSNDGFASTSDVDNTLHASQVVVVAVERDSGPRGNDELSSGITSRRIIDVASRGRNALVSIVCRQLIRFRTNKVINYSLLCTK